MKTQIRRAEPSESTALAGEISEIQAEIGQRGWSERQVRESLTDAQARVWLGVDPAGIQAFVVARRIVDLLEIDLVGVRRSARRRGLATSLITALVDEETQMGMTEARLELASRNRPAMALYAALGFVVVGRRTRYYPDGDDALLLSWTREDARRSHRS